LGGLKRHWQFEEMGPGQLKATQADAKRRAVISVTYTKTGYRHHPAGILRHAAKGGPDPRQLQSLDPLFDSGHRRPVVDGSNRRKMMPRSRRNRREMWR
jgi:hypothetical protein